MKSVGLAAIMRAGIETDSNKRRPLLGGPSGAQEAPSPVHVVGAAVAIQQAAASLPRDDAASIERSKASEFQAGYDAVKSQNQRASTQWSAEFMAGRHAVLSRKRSADKG